MTTATPELKIEPKLPVLSFNFEQLKTWATSLTERYANMVVTEEAIADVKRDMADINRAKKIVDDSRKEAVRRVSEPLTQRMFQGERRATIQSATRQQGFQGGCRRIIGRGPRQFGDEQGDVHEQTGDARRPMIRKKQTDG